MFHVILLSLGMLLSSAPGLGGLTCFFETAPPPLAARHALALCHSATPQRLPSPASREETGLSDPEEKEEESHQFLLGCAAWAGDGSSAIGCRDCAAGPVPGHGLLLQLDHSWQLRC
jgi:hypothetical protein